MTTRTSGASFTPRSRCAAGPPPKNSPEQHCCSPTRNPLTSPVPSSPSTAAGQVTDRAGSAASTRWSLLQEQQRLSVEPGEVHDGAGEAPGAEIEGHDVVFSYAIEATVWPESQSPRPAEARGAFQCEDTHELPCRRVIFTHARYGVRSAERPFAGNHDVPVRSELQIKGAQLGVGDQARRAQRPGAVEHSDGVVACTGRRDA